MTITWYPGQSVRLTVAFYVSTTLTDPTEITLMVEDPSGNIDTYLYSLAQVTKASTGQYRKDITLDEEGTWKWRWAGTGTVIAAEEGELQVTRSVFV